MRIVNLYEQHAEEAFALKAAKAFKNNPKINTYTDGEIEEDALFAVKWGMANQAVLILTIAKTPVIYGDIIPVKEEGAA